jgi:hypothetical protein
MIFYMLGVVFLLVQLCCFFFFSNLKRIFPRCSPFFLFWALRSFLLDFASLWSSLGVLEAVLSFFWYFSDVWCRILWVFMVLGAVGRLGFLSCVFCLFVFCCEEGANCGFAQCFRMPFSCDQQGFFLFCFVLFHFCCASEHVWPR